MYFIVENVYFVVIYKFEYTVALSPLEKPIKQIPNSFAKSTAKVEQAETAITNGIFAIKALDIIS